MTQTLYSTNEQKVNGNNSFFELLNGFPVIRIHPRSKKPVEANWQTKPVDIDTAKRWVEQGGNLGLLLGRQSGLVDIECDNEEAEVEYQRLFNYNPPITPTWQGRRGKHRLFKWDDRLPPLAKFNVGNLEIRGGSDAAAQSVIPPSIHETGIKYDWDIPLSIPVASIPDDVLLKLVAPRPKDDGAESAPSLTTKPTSHTASHDEAIEDIVFDVEDRIEQAKSHLENTPGAKQGKGADNYCFALAVDLLWGYALPEQEAEELLYEWGQKEGQEDESGMYYPWEYHEIRHKIRDALKTNYAGVVGDKLRHEITIVSNQAEINNRIDNKNVDDKKQKGERKQKKKLNRTQKLIALALKNCDLWHSEDRQPYATWKVGDHQENWRIRSSQFKQYLTDLYFDITGDTAGKEATGNTLDVLEGKALRGRYEKVYLRVASVVGDGGRALYIDLGRPTWEAVKVDASGWQIVNNPPVKFIRTNNTGELPLPEIEGDLELLRPLATTTDDNWIKIKGFLLDALKGYKPYFVLSVAGVQGSAKSSLCRLLRQLIDPERKADLSILPRDIEGLRVDVETEHLLAYDNVSFIPQWLSDGLCCISTGAGFKTRQLYTDNGQNVVGGARPVLLNGIPQSVESNDLLSRCLLVEKMPPKNIATEEILNKHFNEIGGKVFGGMLNLLVNGLSNMDTTNITKLPRMADSVKWITACLGDNSFLDAYADNEDEATELGLEASPIAKVIMDLMKIRTHWEGSCQELRKALNELVQGDVGKDYPATTKALGKRLKRDVPALSKVGIEVVNQKTNGKRVITIWNKNEIDPETESVMKVIDDLNK